MSLCRWSSMNWKCDLYCYYDCNGGITTHVAKSRIVGDVPEVHPSQGKLKQPIKKQNDFLKAAQRLPIGLPHDGETFNDPDLESFNGRLTYLRDLGYVFPDELFDIDEEP